MKKVIAAPTRPVKHYNNAVRAEGKFVFVATQPSIDWETGAFIDGDIESQSRRALENVRMFLEKSGSSLENAVKIGIFLADLKDFEAMNRVYEEFFPDPETAPVRFTLRTPFPDARIKVEFEAIALAE
ncbi:MAG: RidA family protein [Alphaproteobacteria bacterium]|jgi:2-iminobutanoate/2-iminopropanoate deaminase